MTGTDHDHCGEYAGQRHRHDDLERDGERLQGLLGEIDGQLGQLRGELPGAVDRIRQLEDDRAAMRAQLDVLDRLRPTCVICDEDAADRQTARGPACTGCIGDPPGDSPNLEHPETWAFPGPQEFGPAPGPDEPCPRLRVVRRAPGT